nr:MAG TPA: hypothetical protein [Caudoviricetes sp.]
MFFLYRFTIIILIRYRGFKKTTKNDEKGFMS